MILKVSHVFKCVRKFNIASLKLIFGDYFTLN